MILLDSYAWIEFFSGSEKGMKVKRILELHECFTSIVSIAEITMWCLRNDLFPKKFIGTMHSYSKILQITEHISELAGKINFEHKKKIKNWGMLDSFIYASARIYGLKTLTGDPHFKNLEDVEML